MMYLHLTRSSVETGIKDAQVYIAEINRLHNSLQILVTEHLPIREDELMATSGLTAQEAAKLYCPLSERIVGHVLLHTATVQVCRITRSLEFTNEDERQVYLTFVRTMEVNAAKGAVKALKIFGEEVRKLSWRMQGHDVTPDCARAVAEIQEHPCLLLSVSNLGVLVIGVHDVNLGPVAVPSDHRLPRPH